MEYIHRRNANVRDEQQSEISRFDMELSTAAYKAVHQRDIILLRFGRRCDAA